jgi:hypothetical protein
MEGDIIRRAHDNFYLSEWKFNRLGDGRSVMSMRIQKCDFRWPIVEYRLE